MDPAPLHERHPILRETYDELVASDQEPSDYIVAIAGKRATGTSKHAKDLSIEFGIERVDNGSIQRQTAREHGYDDADTFREEHPDADVRTDANKLRRAFAGDPLIAEGRLDAAALSADRDDGRPIAAVRIKLTCDDRERARRYAMREYGYDDGDVPEDVIDEALDAVRAGDAKVYDAFADVYDGIDPTQDAFYDYTVDNTGDYDAVHQQLVDILEAEGFERRTDLSPEEQDALGL